MGFALPVLAAVTAAAAGNRLGRPALASWVARARVEALSASRRRWPPSARGRALAFHRRLLEVVAATAAGTVVAVRSSHLDALAFGVFAVVASLLAMADIATLRLPDRLTWPLYPALAALLVLAAACQPDDGSLPRALAGMLVLTAGYAVLAAACRGALGLGDVKLAGVLGLMLGWLGWTAVALGAFLGFLLAAGFAVGLLAFTGAGRNTRLPFAPFMLGGAWLATVVVSGRTGG